MISNRHQTLSSKQTIDLPSGGYYVENNYERPPPRGRIALKDRKPAVAGLFYPADPGELTTTIAGFFSEVEKIPLSGPPIALIAPHAGYPYSGRVAAKAYKLLEGLHFDTVVIVSPSHTVFFKGASIFNGETYKTPLGIVPVDRDLVRRMGDISPSVFISEQGHATGSTRGEHALEVHLPFLQIVLGDFKLVPIVMGDQEDDTIGQLAEILAASLNGRSALMVASTDLSHFHSEKKARRLDRTVQTAIEKFDPGFLMDTLEDGHGEACGGGPVAAVMSAARRLGGVSSHIVEYTTSAESSGDFESVVGYLSAVIVAGKKARVGSTMGTPAVKAKETVELDEDAQKALHHIAKESIKARLAGVDYKPTRTAGLTEKRGIFVTVKLDDALRGCIGQIRARQPLYEAVSQMAVAAAFEDPRFAPLTEAEADKVEIEISVLTPLVRVHDYDEIEVGRDGLMIKLEFHSGLLLPQVATDNEWEREEFLEQTCLKAGLPMNRYRDRQTEIYRFSAQVF
jgi:AmmeMemoRadiSam system protein B/AmmeMemoRadiSam system protein A